MSDLRCQIAIGWVAATLSTTAAANDAAFGGAGADLVPLTETRVRMQSEDITLRFEQNRWLVDASYVFVNDSPHDVSLQVGFPELRCQRFQEDCNDVAFEGLVTRVDGQPVDHREGQLHPSQDWADYLGVVWLYDVSFPAGREVRVQHGYAVRSGADNYFNRFTSYVARTGARWAGAIGQARFRVVLPACAHTVAPTAGIPLESIRTVSEGPNAPYVEVRFEQRDWVPQEDLWFSFSCSAELAAGRLGTDALKRSGLFPQAECPGVLEIVNDLTPEQRTGCRDLIYASRGFPFAREDLQRYFYGNPYDWRLEPGPWGEGQVWARGLRPFAEFDPSWIDWPEDSLLESAGIVEAPARQGSLETPGADSASTERVATAATVAPARGARCGCTCPAAPPPGRWCWLLAGLALVRRRHRRRARPLVRTEPRARLVGYGGSA